MTIHIIGGGWYGCHIASELIDRGYDNNNIKLYEMRSRLFDGASGANPSRLHLGPHYPRSHETRRLCQANYKKFMHHYGDFTRGIQTNIYAIAKYDSMVDYANYVQVLKGEIQFIEIENPVEFGLINVEGAILTGERHILINKVREYFAEKLQNIVEYNTLPPKEFGKDDILIDCTFCALDAHDIDRYEPCITHIYEGDWTKAVTIMDGQFPSIYPHYEPNTVSLTSAKFTPISKTCKTYKEAQTGLNQITQEDVIKHAEKSSGLMREYYPSFAEYKRLDSLLAIRAMPRSGADSRIWKLEKKADNHLIVRAGKIDAIFDAADAVLAEIRYDPSHW